MPDIIDAHIHHYPPEIAADLSRWGREQGEPHWNRLMASVDPRGRPLQTWPSLEQLRRDMERAGIARAVLMGWYWENPDTCGWHNAHYQSILRAQPDTFYAFASVQPAAGMQAVENARKALDCGMSGIGECFPAAQGFAMDNKAWEAICELAAERHVPVCLHVPEPAGHPNPGRVDVDLQSYVELAAKFPGTNFIFAHWGGGLPFFERNRYCRRRLANVTYDSAASPLLYDKRIWRTVCDLVGPEKMIFGSDYPLRLYPRQEAAAGFDQILAEATQSDLTTEEWELISSRNISRLLGISC